MRKALTGTTALGGLLLALGCAAAGTGEEEERPRQLLAIGMSRGWQHESVSDALATLYRLGKESGLWETTIRTDVELVTREPLELNAKNLDHFDAVFFMTSGELPLDDEQKAALLSFVREDGKGFLGAHNATDTFYEWPAYGELIGGYFDGHPWDRFEAVVRVEDRSFPATRHFPESFAIFDEIYQIRGFSRDRSHVLMSLDISRAEMEREGVTRDDVPIAWTRHEGAGRVFYCSLGHVPAVWEREDVRRMWLEAVTWAMRLD